MTVHEAPTDVAAFTAEWEDWHRQQEARLADPHGFLAITSLHWLDADPQRFPDAPGTWSTGPEGVRVVLDPGDELVVDGVLVTGEHSFGVIPERGSINAVWGDAVIEVAKRGGYDIVRPRRPDAPLRTAFLGTPAYPPHPAGPPPVTTWPSTHRDPPRSGRRLTTCSTSTRRRGGSSSSSMAGR